jgi:predicted RNA-binding protein with PUA-like domain
MTYWLVKSEPSSWSWNDQVKKKITHWDGVRNFQARNFLKQMKIGDLCFFYHSVVGKQIMGIVKVSSMYKDDPSDNTGKFGMVDMEYVHALKSPVTLEQIKKTEALQNLSLIKQSRLSVMPVTKVEWDCIIGMSEKINN